MSYRLKQAGERARRATARIEAELEQAVREARQAGMTWEEVAEALGMTRQGAQRKYAGRMNGHDHEAAS